MMRRVLNTVKMDGAPLHACLCVLVRKQAAEHRP